MIHSIVVIIVDSSPLLPWWARQSWDERRVFGCIWGGAAIGSSAACAQGRGAGHSHSEVAV